VKNPDIPFTGIGGSRWVGVGGIKKKKAKKKPSLFMVLALTLPTERPTYYTLLTNIIGENIEI
jgi:hypothetical protein